MHLPAAVRTASSVSLLATLFLVGCDRDPVVPTDAGGPFAESGLLTVHTSTTGRWIPDDGVQILVDDDPATVRPIDLNGSVEVPLPPGDHTVELFRGGGRPFYPACSVDGGNRRDVTIEPGGSALADFEVFCEVVLDLRVSTTGVLTDTDGYRLIVSPYAWDLDFTFLARSIAPDDRVVYDRDSSRLWWRESNDPPQTLALLWGAAPNCTLLGPNPVPLNPGGRVLEHEITVECVDPPPASGTIYFSGGEGDLYRLEADGSGLTTVSDGWDVYVGEWTMSPDGDEVIIGSGGSDFFVRASLDGTAFMNVYVEGGFAGEELHWGANDRLYFRAFSEAEEREEVYSVRLDGTDRRRVSDGIGWHPALSPDGTTLIYEGASGLVLSDADGGNVRPVPLDIHLQQLTWSPDGTRVAGVARGEFGSAELLVFDPVSGDAEVVKRAPFEWRLPYAWSPDGSQLVYRETPGSEESPLDWTADPDFFTVSADGYNLARLTTSGLPFVGRMAWED